MNVPILLSRAQVGVEAPVVRVETHLAPRLPAFNVVGLPEAAVRESRDRVRSAIVNAGFQFPQQRITVNLAPADLPKHGGRFDLPIALGILIATGQPGSIRDVDDLEFVGELACPDAFMPWPESCPPRWPCATPNTGSSFRVKTPRRPAWPAARYSPVGG